MAKSDSLSPRAQRKRDARTQTIIETAEKIIVDEGLDALTIHRLARTLDYAPGALYRYFDSKEKLISELSCRAIQRIHDRLKLIEERVDKRGKSPSLLSLVRLLESANMYSALIETDPATHRLVGSLLGDPKHILNEKEAERVHSETVPVLMSFTKLIQDAEETGALQKGPANERAVAFWAGLQGIVQLRKMVHHATILQSLVDPEKIADRFVYDLLIGWGADESLLSTAHKAAAENT